jgi:phosphatidate cytidylyltransferase
LTPTAWAVGVLLVLAAGGLLAAAVYGLIAARRRSERAIEPRTVVARAASYAALAVVLALAVALAPIGIAIVVLVVGWIGLYEWARLADLPLHHRYALLIADAVVVGAVYVQGAAAADWLVAGIVLVGALWPVVRSNTARAVRDLGMAAIGFVFVAVNLVYAVALNYDYPSSGPILFAALALACAGSDVGAFIVGRRFGRTKLAPTLSPNKMRAGVAGNFAGAAIGLVPMTPAVAVVFEQEGIPWWFGVALVPIVAIGAVWGDLFKSAVKREAGVKDFGAWLPGFGGLLDRVDSLLLTLPLTYWSLRLIDAAGVT